MQTMVIKRSLLAALIVSAYTPAYADEPEQADMGTVQVVGSINKLPGVPFKQAKSAVRLDAETLDNEGVTKADELGRYQAGFTNQPFGSDTNTNWFRIRGTEASQSYDGAPAVTYGFFQPYTQVFGLEAVEVNKGADALAYGAANSGGLINYISKRPHRSQVGHGTVEAYVGNRNQRGIVADYTGALNADQSVRYRLVGAYGRADGDWQSTYNESYYFAPSLAADLGERTRLTLLASIQKDQGTPSSNFLPQSGTLVGTPLGYIPRSNNLGDPTQDKERNTAKSFGYEFSHDFGSGFSFSQNYRYQHVDNYHRGTYAYPAGAYDAAWNPLPLTSSGYQVGRGVVFNDGTAKSHSVDNRFSWHFQNGTLDNTLLAGIDYRRQNVDALYTLFGSAGNVNVFDPAASYGQTQTIQAPHTGIKSRQLGFYLNNSAKLFNRIGITAGVRHDRARSEETGGQAVRANHTSYSGSLMYYGDGGFNPYFAYSEAFRLPTGLSGNQTLYEPNFTEQYEAGIKYTPSWLDGTASLAVFKARDRGALVSNGIGATVSSADPIKRKGVEIQVRANLSDSISGQLSYTYLSSITDSNGRRIRNPLIPKHSAGLRGEYLFQGGALNGLALGAGIRYTGRSYTADGSMYSGRAVPSSTVIDLFARYAFANGWQAQIQADNIADRRYLAGCDYYCYYGQGRSITGKLSYRF